MPTAVKFSLQRSVNRLYALREESILRIRLNQRVRNVKQQQGLRPSHRYLPSSILKAIVKILNPFLWMIWWTQRIMNLLRHIYWHDKPDSKQRSQVCWYTYLDSWIFRNHYPLHLRSNISRSHQDHKKSFLLLEFVSSVPEHMAVSISNIPWLVFDANSDNLSLRIAGLPAPVLN